MDKLLTQKDLAERWQVTVKAIENWRKDGTITPVEGIPAIRFNPEYIEKLEGTKLERFSPLERRRLEKENEELKRQNQQLHMIVANIFTESSKLLSYPKLNNFDTREEKL